MQFGSGLSGSVVGGLYGGSGTPPIGSAASPAGTSGPTGSPSLMAAAWGIGDDGHSQAPVAASWIAGLALAGLVMLWWVLPR